MKNEFSLALAHTLPSLLKESCIYVLLRKAERCNWVFQESTMKLSLSWLKAAVLIMQTPFKGRYNAVLFFIF